MRSQKAKGKGQSRFCLLHFALCVLPFDLFLRNGRTSQKAKRKSQMAKPVLPFALCVLPFDLFLWNGRTSQKAKRPAGRDQMAKPVLYFAICVLPFDLFLCNGRICVLTCSSPLRQLRHLPRSIPRGSHRRCAPARGWQAFHSGRGYSPSFPGALPKRVR